MRDLRQFGQDSSGATSIEYGLIAALISAFVIGALGLIGTRLNTAFNSVSSALTP